MRLLRYARNDNTGQAENPRITVQGSLLTPTVAKPRQGDLLTPGAAKPRQDALLSQALKVSPHSLAIFRQCRQQYKFLKIDKLGDQYSRPRPYFTMANHVHATLRDFLSIPVAHRTPETIIRLLRRNWLRYRAGFRSRADERRWAEKALGQLSRFAREQDLTVLPLMLEEPVEARLTAGLVLNGVVDRVDRQADGSLHIIDYKTGVVPRETDWTQLNLYALILSHGSPNRVDRLSVHYLTPGEVQTIIPTSQTLQQTGWELLVTARDIQKEKRYPPNPGPACRSCDFKPICPAKNAADPQEAPDTENGDGQLELWRMNEGQEQAAKRRV